MWELWEQRSGLVSKLFWTNVRLKWWCVNWPDTQIASSARWMGNGRHGTEWKLRIRPAPQEKGQKCSRKNELLFMNLLSQCIFWASRQNSEPLDILPSDHEPAKHDSTSNTRDSSSLPIIDLVLKNVMEQLLRDVKRETNSGPSRLQTPQVASAQSDDGITIHHSTGEF